MLLSPFSDEEELSKIHTRHTASYYLELRFECNGLPEKQTLLNTWLSCPMYVCSIDLNSTLARLLKVLNNSLSGLTIIFSPTIMDPDAHISLSIGHFIESSLTECF